MQKNNNNIPLRGLLIWSITVTFFLYEFFLRTFIGSVSHQVMADLQLNAERFSLVGTAYYFAYGLMQIPVGMLADRFSIKLILSMASLLCALSSIFLASASGLSTAFLSRFLMGIGSSFAFVCVLLVVLSWFPRRYFAFFSGLSQFFGTMGPLFAGGPMIALMIAHHQTWRRTMQSMAYVGLLLMGLSILFVRNKDSITTSLVSTERHKRPSTMMADLLHLLGSRQVAYVVIYSSVLYAPLAFFGAIWGGEFLQAHGYSQVQASATISFAWLAYALACPLLGMVSDYYQRRRPLMIACAMLGVLATVSIIYLPIVQKAWQCDALFMMLGIAAAGQNIGFAAIAEQVNPAQQATALGFNNAGISFTNALVAVIISHFIYQASHGAVRLTSTDFVYGLIILPLCYLIALYMSCWKIQDNSA